MFEVALFEKIIRAFQATLLAPTADAMLENRQQKIAADTTGEDDDKKNPAHAATLASKPLPHRPMAGIFQFIRGFIHWVWG